MLLLAGVTGGLNGRSLCHAPSRTTLIIRAIFTTSPDQRLMYTGVRCQVRFSHLDLSTAKYLDIETGELRPRAELLRKLNRLKSKNA